MKFKTVKELKDLGFIGFKSMRELFDDCTVISKARGVYMVLYVAKELPSFVNVGSGGHFKGKDPNVLTEVLKDEWVDDTIVVYIGKAGKDGSKATLLSRLKQYLRFGQGQDVGHWGGRYIWQIKDLLKLIVCWKPLQSQDPANLESELIQEFKLEYGKRPFANLKD